MRAILEGKITPILQREPKIPQGLAAVFERTLARDPKERFPNAGEMLAAMKAAT